MKTLEFLIEKFSSKPIYLNMGAGKLAKRWNVSEDLIKEAKSKVRQNLTSVKEAQICEYVNQLEEMITKVSKEKGTLESITEVDYQPKNDEELAELHKIDLDKYKIVNYWTKLKSNGKFTSSVFCKLRTPEEFDPQRFMDFLNSYSPSPFNVKVFVSEDDNTKKTVDVEISVADVHLNRLTLKPQSIQERAAEFFKVVENLIKTVSKSYNVRNIVFPIGNDFFNSDTFYGTTTNGTPQENSAKYDTAYEVGFDVLTRVIILLKSNCQNLQVFLIQGNHDRVTSYYLVHGLQAFFKNIQGIYFTRQASNTKFITLGNTFIGYHHGNTKIEELPLVFATSPDSAPYFGTSKFREIHTADKHHYMVKEIKGSGVRIQQIPSLALPDRWSDDSLYINNIRAGLALVYDPEKGKIAEIEERL